MSFNRIVHSLSTRGAFGFVAVAAAGLLTAGGASYLLAGSADRLNITRFRWSARSLTAVSCTADPHRVSSIVRPFRGRRGGLTHCRTGL